MTEPSVIVLAALTGGPRHGYAIVGEVEELSEHGVQLKIGSLYGVLDRLATEGQVELDRADGRVVALVCVGAVLVALRGLPGRPPDRT